MTWFGLVHFIDSFHDSSAFFLAGFAVCFSVYFSAFPFLHHFIPPSLIVPLSSSFSLPFLFLPSAGVVTNFVGSFLQSTFSLIHSPLFLFGFCSLCVSPPLPLPCTGVVTNFVGSGSSLILFIHSFFQFIHSLLTCFFIPLQLTGLISPMLLSGFLFLPFTGIVTNFVGSGSLGSADGRGLTASFNQPAGKSMSSVFFLIFICCAVLRFCLLSFCFPLWFPRRLRLFFRDLYSAVWQFLRGWLLMDTRNKKWLRVRVGVSEYGRELSGLNI